MYLHQFSNQKDMELSISIPSRADPHRNKQYGNQKHPIFGTFYLSILEIPLVQTDPVHAGSILPSIPIHPHTFKSLMPPARGASITLAPGTLSSLDLLDVDFLESKFFKKGFNSRTQRPFCSMRNCNIQHFLIELEKTEDIWGCEAYLLITVRRNLPQVRVPKVYG